MAAVVARTPAVRLLVQPPPIPLIAVPLRPPKKEKRLRPSAQADAAKKSAAIIKSTSRGRVSRIRPKLSLTMRIHFIFHLTRSNGFLFSNRSTFPLIRPFN